MTIRHRIGDALRRTAKRVDGRDPKVALVLGEMPRLDYPTEIRFNGFDCDSDFSRLRPGMTTLVGFPVLHHDPTFKIGGIA